MSLSRPHPPRPLEINRVIARTFSVLRRSWMVILPLAILLEWAPNGAQAWLLQTMGARYGGGPYGLAALSVAWWLIFPVADMAVVVAALAVLNSHRTTFASALATAVRFYPVAVGLDLLQNLVGLAEPWLLVGKQSEATQLATTGIEIVYGLASAALLLPSLAAAAQERLGLRAGLVRSAAVTAGNRLRVAALAALLLFLQMLVAPLAQALIVAMLGASPAALVASYLPHTLVFCFASASQATLYWELVRIRDGAAPGEVDAIFG
jgi:hypothetical protein